MLSVFDRMFKSTDNYESGFELTNTMIPNTLRRVSKISEVSIINTAGYDISVVDTYGIITEHTSIKMNKSFSTYLSTHPNSEGVFIIHRRLMNGKDLAKTIDAEERIKRSGESYTIIHNGLHDLSNPDKLKEIYIIYSVESIDLRKNRAVHLKELDLTISIKGYEHKRDTAVVHKGIQTAPMDDTIYSNITYYNPDPNSYIFINILGSVIRLDATISDHEYVLFTHDESNIVKERCITVSEFKKNNIFKSNAEAEANMDMDSIIAIRKLDIEKHSIETKLITNIVSDIAAVYKLKVDLIIKKYTVSLDLEKLKLAKEEKDNKCQLVDNTKKYIEVLSMIKKIILA